MTEEQVIETMELRMSPSRTEQYREIYKMSTGETWNKCMCGNNFNRLYQICKNYANSLKNKIQQND